MNDIVPVVFLPGLLDDRGMWDHQVARLAGLAPMIAVDLATPRSIAEAAEQVLDAAPERFAAVGFSLGGYVLFDLLRRAPERIDRIALIDTSARPDTPERRLQREATIARAESGEFVALVDEILPQVVHPSRRNDERLMGAIRAMALRVGPETFVNQQRTIMTRPDSRPDLRDIRCPALVVCGRQDTLTPPALSEEIAAGIVGARLVLIDDCNHYAPMERPYAVTALLQQWMRYP